jgi:hypothetical protein
VGVWFAAFVGSAAASRHDGTGSPQSIDLTATAHQSSTGVVGIQLGCVAPSGTTCHGIVDVTAVGKNARNKSHASRAIAGHASFAVAAGQTNTTPVSLNGMTKLLKHFGTFSLTVKLILQNTDPAATTTTTTTVTVPCNHSQPVA